MDLVTIWDFHSVWYRDTIVQPRDRKFGTTRFLIDRSTYRYDFTSLYYCFEEKWRRKCFIGLLMTSIKNKLKASENRDHALCMGF